MNSPASNQAPPEGDADQQAPQERDYEAEARASGWVDQDVWTRQGKPAEKWSDAKTFVERGETYFPFVRAKLKNSLDKIDKLEATVQELREGNRRFNDYHKQVLEQQKATYDRRIAELEAKREKAVTEGNGQAFAEADRQLQEMRAAPPQQTTQQTRQSSSEDSPETVAWKAANPWYEGDKELGAIADGLAAVVATENPGLQGKAFLDKLTERVRSVVPHKFQNANRSHSPTEGHNPARTSSTKARTYDALPAQAKIDCDNFVRRIPGFTREQYVATFDGWEN